LRAFTPKDQKAVKTAAETFRANPSFKTADAIMELGTGEALVSFLEENGAPSVVERAKILFPLSQIGAVSQSQRELIIRQSRLYGRYDKVIDRESAFEVLMAEAEEAMKAEQEVAEIKEKPSQKQSSEGGSGLLKGIFGAVVGAMVTSVTSSIGSEVSKKVTGRQSKTTVKDIAGKAVGSAARTVTRQLTRSVLGTLLK
jgi:CRP-like cAMP-binding protein